MQKHDVQKVMKLVEHAIDMHVHPMPDLIPRGFSDKECGYAAISLGMDGFVIKNHYWPTAYQLQSLNESFGKEILFGSITLNHYVGGINPYAVEVALGFGTKVIWLPTRHAKNHMEHTVPGKILFNPTIKLREAKGIELLDEKGRLIPEMYEIFKLVAENDACLMTAHISNEEAYVVCTEALKNNVKKIVLSHPDFSVNMTPLDLQIDLAKQGVIIEKTMFGIHSGVRSVEEMLESIRKIGPDKCIFSTDYGPAVLPKPWEGMIECVCLLLENGFSEQDIKMMICNNPHTLLNLDCPAN